ncbi:MAG: DUF4136 domain-containing protein [Pontibacter sp.]|nr:DUF4136 domain-containing protein [Pontibacter sp.]
MPENKQYLYRADVNFKRFRTFDWYKAEVPKPLAGGAGPQFNLLLDQRIKEAIMSEMIKDGFRPDITNPDLLIAYDLAVDTQYTPKDNYAFPAGFGYGYSYWYGYRFRYTTTEIEGYRSVQNYPPGTLLIDIIDPNTNQLLWRGFAEAGINPTSQDMERIALAVADILSQFPPTPSTLR